MFLQERRGGYRCKSCDRCNADLTPREITDKQNVRRRVAAPPHFTFSVQRSGDGASAAEQEGLAFSIVHLCMTCMDDGAKLNVLLDQLKS